MFLMSVESCAGGVIFDAPLEQRWELALASSGIDPAFVSTGGLGPLGGGIFGGGGNMEA